MKVDNLSIHVTKHDHGRVIEGDSDNPMPVVLIGDVLIVPDDEAAIDNLLDILGELKAAAPKSTPDGD